MKIAVRWTIGDVSDRGFAALRLSIWGAWKLFGRQASYTVCVNMVSLESARQRTGDLPLVARVHWRDATGDLPAFLASHFDGCMAEGVGWKFAPLRLQQDAYELSLDNDCILWDLPRAVREWLSDADGRACVFAEDVRPCLGQFSGLSPVQNLNSGIRGLPPGFDFEAALRETLAAQAAAQGHPVVLASELDEQGLQAAALTRHANMRVVSTHEVSICSPFWPHNPRPGTCGAHFVGLNARHLPWDYYDRPADLWRREHWDSCSDELHPSVGAPPAGHRAAAEHHNPVLRRVSSDQSLDSALSP